MVVKNVLMSEKGTQTKVRLMTNVHHVDLFVTMKVTKEKINWVIK
jgi:hypothetical protein